MSASITAEGNAYTIDASQKLFIDAEIDLAVAKIEIESQDPAFFDNRLHFHWIDNPTERDGNGEDRSFKGLATVQIANGGEAPLDIVDWTIDGPFALVEPGILQNATIAPGETIDVMVAFDRAAFTRPVGERDVVDFAQQVIEGELTLNTSDIAAPSVVVDLAAFWQPTPEGGYEPNVNEVWELFGFGNEIDGLTKIRSGKGSVFDFDDIYLAVDETEIRAPFFRIADTATEARLTQIAAFHSPRVDNVWLQNPANLFFVTQANSHRPNDNQTILPRKVDGDVLSFEFDDGNIPNFWAGDDLFSIRIFNQSSNPEFNPSGPGAPTQAKLDAAYPGFTVAGDQVFDPAGNPVFDGYTIRTFQALDAAGNPIANTILVIMDYTGLRYDFNDHMFVLEGVTPVGFDGADLVYDPNSVIVPDLGQKPFNETATAWLVDGAGLTLNAAQFDDGGAAVAYSDVPGLSGGTDGGRAGSDVEVTAGGAVGWIVSGEWLEYTIDVASAGTFELSFLSSLGTESGGPRMITATFADAGGVYASASTTIAPTGAWATFVPTEPIAVDLEAGEQVLRLTFTGGSQDILSFSLAPQATGGEQTPFAGVVPTIASEGATTILANTFDEGGQGIAWNDVTSRDGGAQTLRINTDVQLVGPAQDIGFVEAGEWVEYTLNVEAAGTYALSLDAKAPVAGNSIAASIEDGPALATFTLPDANGAGDDGFAGTEFAATDPIALELAAGEQTLRLTFDGTPAANGFLLDFRSFTLDAMTTPPPLSELTDLASFANDGWL